MKTLIMTVAAAALMSGTAYAQDPVNKANADVKVESRIATEGFTDQSEWVGKSVYDSNMKRVGEIERVSLDADGEVDEIVVETGGFLDIGGHEILIAADKYKLVTTESKTDVQLGMTSKAFSTMPRFDEAKVSDYPLSDNVMTDDENETSIASDTRTETYTKAKADTKTKAYTNAKADKAAKATTMQNANVQSMSVIDGFTDLTEWINKPVYDSNMDRVGEIKRVSFGSDGQVDDIIVKTGGFLDMGGHEVMIADDQYMRVASDNNPDKANIQLQMTADRFKAMPHFDKTTGMNTALSDDAMFSGENNVETQASYETNVETDDSNSADLENNTYVETDAETELNADADAMKSVEGFTDDAEWVGKAVYDSNMDRVGNVERVSFGTDGQVDDIVVETGGFLDIGGHEVMIAADQYTLVTAQGDEGDTEIQLQMTADTFGAMPHFDESTVSDYALSDDKMLEGNDDAEADIEVETDTGVNVE